MPAGALRNRRTACLGLVLIVPLGLFLLHGLTQRSSPEPQSGTPLAGFSYSPKMARWARHDPVAGLRTLLQQVHPDLVRLPVYWDSAAPSRDRLDFNETDRLLEVIAQYNATEDQKVRVVLVVGARNLGAPELYLPSWLTDQGPLDLPAKLRSPAYTEYLINTFRRYASNPLLYGWQVENEPLDSTNPDLGNIAVPAQLVAEEVDLAHRLDPAHPVVITTFNSATAELDRNADGRLGGILHLASPWKPAGHPRPALELGDVLGLNAYVATPNTPLARVSIDQRIAWKRDTLQYWATQARSKRKQVWVTEMQAAPWVGVGGFTLRDLGTSAQLYRDSGVSAVFLWGAEQWLASPEWLSAARQAIATLNSTPFAARRPQAPAVAS